MSEALLFLYPTIHYLEQEASLFYPELLCVRFL